MGFVQLVGFWRLQLRKTHIGVSPILLLGVLLIMASIKSYIRQIEVIWP
jgi:hypothetical protein